MEVEVVDVEELVEVEVELRNGMPREGMRERGVLVYVKHTDNSSNPNVRAVKVRIGLKDLTPRQGKRSFNGGARITCL